MIIRIWPALCVTVGVFRAKQTLVVSLQLGIREAWFAEQPLQCVASQGQRAPAAWHTSVKLIGLQRAKQTLARTVASNRNSCYGACVQSTKSCPTQLLRKDAPHILKEYGVCYQARRLVYCRENGDRGAKASHRCLQHVGTAVCNARHVH